MTAADWKELPVGAPVRANGFAAVKMSSSPRYCAGARGVTDWLVTVRLADERTTLNGYAQEFRLEDVVSA